MATVPDSDDKLGDLERRVRRLERQLEAVIRATGSVEAVSTVETEHQAQTGEESDRT